MYHHHTMHMHHVVNTFRASGKQHEHLLLPQPMVTVRPLTVHWHQDSAPIYSVDFQPNEEGVPVNYSARFATSGGDNNIRLWRLKNPPQPGDPPNVEYLATLATHDGAVNAAKFNRQGDVLAAAGDDAVVSLWALSASTPPRAFGSDYEDLETWRVLRKCRSASVGEIYDLAWSPSGRFLAATSMDKVVSIMDVKEGHCVAVLRDHKHYVQGVAWDPKEELLATQSSDQTVLVYQILHPTPETIQIGAPFRKLDRCELDERQLQFHTESFPSFFRRLAFSPDGNLLVVPAGLWKAKLPKEPVASDPNTANAEVSASADPRTRPQSGDLRRDVQNCAYVYARNDWRRPQALLPLARESLAVKFNPVVFTLRSSNPVVALPYRFVYAVATINGVFLYDTEQSAPLGMASDLHYSSLTDLAWSPDGRTLLVTSIDGFCSVLRFEPRELGVPYAGSIGTEPKAGPTLTEGAKIDAAPVINTLTVRKKAPKMQPPPDRSEPASKTELAATQPDAKTALEPPAPAGAASDSSVPMKAASDPPHGDSDAEKMAVDSL